MPNEQFLFVGLFLVVAGFVPLLLGSVLGAEKSQVKVGVGGFIGPVPFGFANDPRLLTLVLVLSAVVLVLLFMR